MPELCTGSVSTEVCQREWTVATFVVHNGRVLLLYHRKLQKWLPPGGHIEPGEIPDDAAVREVWEETGIRIQLVGEPALGVHNPRQLVRPRGIQLEVIAPNHEHIDLVYMAKPCGDTTLTGNTESTQIGWYGPAELQHLGLTDEIRQWVELVLRES